MAVQAAGRQAHRLVTTNAIPESAMRTLPQGVAGLPIPIIHAIPLTFNL
jgi:hypothetical protein